MKPLTHRLTYANVVATFALVAALGTGGAYAATQLAKNSVGSKQLRKGAVTSRALKNGGIASRDLSRSVRTQLGATEFARVNGDGTSDGGTASSVTGSAGRYIITFRHEVARCGYAATPVLSGAGEPTGATAKIVGRGGRQLTVETYDAAGNLAATGFHVIVIC